MRDPNGVGSTDPTGLAASSSTIDPTSRSSATDFGRDRVCRTPFDKHSVTCRKASRLWSMSISRNFRQERSRHRGQVVRGLQGTGHYGNSFRHRVGIINYTVAKLLENQDRPDRAPPPALERQCLDRVEECRRDPETPGVCPIFHRSLPGRSTPSAGSA